MQATAIRAPKKLAKFKSGTCEAIGAPRNWLFKSSLKKGGAISFNRYKKA